MNGFRVSNPHRNVDREGTALPLVVGVLAFATAIAAGAVAAMLSTLGG